MRSINTTVTDKIWIQFSPGVILFFEGDRVEIEKPGKRIKCIIKDNSAKTLLEQMKLTPILKDTFSSTNTLENLIKMGFIIEGNSPAQIEANSIHLATSFPLNKGMEYTDIEIKEMQQKALSRRFSNEVYRENMIDIPQQMRRSSSFLTESNENDFKNIENSMIEDLLYTLYNKQNKLYPSAGALYPINIYIENVQYGKSTLYRFDPQTNQIKTQSLDVKNNEDPFFDPVLKKVNTRIWLCADIADTTYKYGPRGYRYSLIEAGHAAQVIIQILNMLGIECRPFGGFDDVRAGEYLGISNEVVTYVIGAFKNKGKSDDKWLLAEESRFALVNKSPIHYAKSYGGKDSKGIEITGYGLDSSYEMARLKSKGELVERLTLINNKDISNSNGMAAHTIYDLALKNAMLELYERHCMLRVWLERSSTASFEIPNTTSGRVALSLCKISNTEIIIKDITDSNYKVPCVMVVVYSKYHGGILTSSAAGLTELEAIEKALLEIIKGLFYRIIIRKVPVFLDDLELTEVNTPGDHEAWYARTIINKKDTEFLVKSTLVKTPKRIVSDLCELSKIIEVNNITDTCPEPSYWFVVHCSSEKLLNLEFGKPSISYWAKAYEILGENKKLNELIHPIG
jgi:SagB-type dehydrogenase family enzyme